MIDILLDSQGDIVLTEEGDIRLEESVRQKIRIKVLWLAEEWRWNRAEGLPYFDRLFVKNPDTDSFEALIRAKIFEVTEVTKVDDVSINFDRMSRIATVRFVAHTDDETIREEVLLYG